MEELASSRVLLAFLGRNAANRRMREFLRKKLEEWFPGKIQKMPESVQFELVDNIAASLLEVVSPGKNKIFDKSEFVEHVDKATGKVDPYVIPMIRTLIENESMGIPSLAGKPKSFYTEFGKKMTDKLMEKGHPSVPDKSKLVSPEGKFLVAPLAYLLGKVVPYSLGKDQSVDPRVVSTELAQAIARIDASSNNYASSMAKMLSGGYDSRDTEMYKALQRGGKKLDTKKMTDEEAQEALFKRIGSSDILYSKLKKIVDTTWVGPVSIPVEPRNLGATFNDVHADAIRGRLNTIGRSELYKDEERLTGAGSRLTKPFPGPNVPWNAGSEVLLEKPKGSDKYSIREGWHRIMAMVKKSQEEGQPKFTLSAYVYNRVPTGLIRSVLDEIAKQRTLRDI